MPRTSVAAQTPKTGYATAIAADALKLTMTAGDVANGNEVPWPSNRVALILQNTDAGTDYYVTVTSSADDRGRLADILTQYDVNFGDVPEMVILERPGWEQTGGLLYLDFENAAVTFAVVALP